jgi:predicted ribosomally synthesized peptide with SipW-like signal peptide
MKKKILVSLIAIALVGTIASLGVTAYFSDTEASSANSLRSKGLDLKVNSIDKPGTVMTIENVKPGDSGSVNVQLTNAGSSNGIASFEMHNRVDNENGMTEPEAAVDYTPGGDLSPKVNMKVYYDGQFSVEGPLNLYNWKYELGPLNPGTKTVTYQWSVPADCGNQIQTDSCTFKLKFYLEQVK